ncbi:bifunctional riboflavin kinase/FAD synthetase [Leucobacter weissii]|uniref:Riboflavin biosynthesis protein n=1 Tax=Leucobacter weissii TaxID=1983706 RepID=A0A939SAU3_9MICO|nr:bifunctional riboflavin kinase/FAD synthetase [Leucobacter weissii]MBO1902307.1 bifunctional riboflavin kinase/FAD synthetase [Leucobacter weissii]
MRTYESLHTIPDDAFPRGTAIAIGKFDGVHLGHRALLARMAEIAEERSLDTLVFTFTNNPLSFLRPEICPEPILSSRQRLEVLERLGETACVMVPFDARLAAVPAEEFVERVLVETLRVGHICVGEDFRFGNGGAGDAAMLARLGERFGFTVEVIEDVEDRELGRISSTRIREAILQGDVGTARRMLGRPATVRGTVVQGDRRGRELGFPTANLGGELEGLVPREGVYAGWALVGGERHPAAISVGVNLTFEPGGDARVEAFLLDYSGDLYGRRIEVQFAERLRGMEAFPDAGALIERMHEDVSRTRGILAEGR